MDTVMDNVIKNRTAYIKTDDNKVINEKCIRWVKKMGDCMEVCTKLNGCASKIDTHRVCKLYNLDSYNRLDKLFE